MPKLKSMVSFPLIFICILTLSGCGFGQKTSPTILLGSCNLEAISGAVPDLIGNYSIKLSTPDWLAKGWIGNNLGGKSPEKVTLSVSDSLGNILLYKEGSTTNRPDVGTFFNKPGMSNSGFEILVNNIEKPGQYTISLQGEYEDGNILCPRTFNLTVN
jgi:hypothetical protein